MRRLSDPMRTPPPATYVASFASSDACNSRSGLGAALGFIGHGPKGRRDQRDRHVRVPDALNEESEDNLIKTLLALRIERRAATLEARRTFFVGDGVNARGRQ